MEMSSVVREMHGQQSHPQTLSSQDTPIMSPSASPTNPSPATVLFKRACRLNNRKMLVQSLQNVSDIPLVSLQTSMTDLVKNNHNTMVQDILHALPRPHRLFAEGGDWCPMYAAANSLNAPIVSMLVDCWLDHLKSSKSSKKRASRHQEIIEMVAFFAAIEERKSEGKLLQDSMVQSLHALLDQTDPAVIKGIVEGQRAIDVQKIKTFHIPQHMVGVIEQRMDRNILQMAVDAQASKTPKKRAAKL